MKKLLALLMTAVIAIAICVSPDGGALAMSGSNGRIYDKTSTGPMVVRIQLRLRELGYLNFKPTGSYKSMTVNAVKDFQVNYRESGYEMQVDGRMGPQSMELLFKYDAMRVSLGGISIPSGPKHASDTLVTTGSLIPWETVKTMMLAGRSYNIIDCYTGKEFKLQYTGGENHAEMEPASEEALADFKEICGREYNFLKRPVVVVIDGQTIAASIQCWPHGADTVPGNGVDGHVCLFFDGSYSNVGHLPDVEHTENIYKAAGQH
ncbi:MAG: peptidoglycan-binding protein [Clostridia bacterium]|nr:peptidoglycan-binding protein [Clostridia bacterium]